MDRSTKSVLVVINQFMGDLVLSTPALRQIRARFPNAHICVAGKSGVIDILANEPYIDELLPLAFYEREASLRTVPVAWRLVRTIRSRRFDWLINVTTLMSPRTYFSCLIFNVACGARQIAGGRLRDCLYWRPAVEAVRLRYLIHETQMHIRLMHGLVAPTKDLTPSLSPRVVPGSVADQLMASAAHPLVGIFAGGSRQSRQWPISNFIRTVQLLHDAVGATCTLIGASSDRPITSAIREAAGRPIFDLTGQIPVRELPGALSALDVLVTNDSGPMHVAAAVRTPLVAILGAESPERFSPVGDGSRITALYHATPCAPCLRIYCGHRTCTAWITPDRVVAAVRELLAINGRQTSLANGYSAATKPSVAAPGWDRTLQNPQTQDALVHGPDN